MAADGLISVIVAVYNIKEYLGRCVESVLAQTYRELEIILVDDGSTDGSAVICDEYAAKDERIRVIHKQNGGLSDARNAGLAVAAGSYIGYVDGDDYVEPEMYGGMLTALREHQAQVAVCGYRQVGAGGAKGSFSGQVTGMSGLEGLEIYICGHRQYRIYPSVWSKLFVREVVGDLRFVVGTSSEDIMYTTKALCRTGRLVYLDCPFYNYIVDRQGSIMNKKAGERRFAFEIPIWREQTDYLQQQGMDELAEKSRYYFYRRMLFYFIEFCESKEKEFARRLARMLREERAVVRRVYRNGWVARGDRVRMKLMLWAPKLYFRAVALYERMNIVLKRSAG